LYIYVSKYAIYLGVYGYNMCMSSNLDDGNCTITPIDTMYYINIKRGSGKVNHPCIHFMVQ